MLLRSTVSTAAICASALLLSPAIALPAPADPPSAPAPGVSGVASPGGGSLATPAPVPNPVGEIGPESREAEVARLRKELGDLEGQTPRNTTRIAAINERLVAIAQQQARNAAENGAVATKTTLTNAEIEQSAAQNTYEAIKNVPGVTQADQASAGGSDNLQIRGIKLASNTGYRLDGGLPIVNNIILSTEDKAQIQVLKGAGALEFGLASPAGIVNYVLKRAGRRPINTVSFSANGYGQAIAALDIGRKFGNAQQYGFRMNYAGGDTGSFVKDAGGTRWIIGMTTDWTSKRARVRLDYEQFGVNVVEQGQIMLNAVDPKTNRITIPRLPDPTKLLSGTWDRNVGMGGNLSGRGEFDLSSGITVGMEAGRSTARRAHRAVGQTGTINLTTGVGTETFSLVRDQDQWNTYENVDVKFKSSAGTAFSNVLTIGATRNSRDSNNPVTPKVTYTQNIYNPIMLPAPVFPDGPIAYQPQHSIDYDYYFQDSAVIMEKMHLVGGLRQINYRSNSTAGLKPSSTMIAFLAPAVGAVLDLSPSLSLYASYVKSLEETPIGPISAKNANALLPPEPSTQREVGVRMRGARGVAATIGYFYIDRANASIDPNTQLYGFTGTNNFQGLESSVNLPLSPIWALNLGGQYMHATEHQLGNPSIDGKIPENTPRLSGNLGLTYRLRSVPGLSLSGQVQSLASRQINAQDQGTIPGVTTYGLGASYTGVFNKQPLTINMSIRNLLNRVYYSSIVNNVLGVGAPRLISVNVRMTP